MPGSTELRRPTLFCARKRYNPRCIYTVTRRSFPRTCLTGVNAQRPVSTVCMWLAGEALPNQSSANISESPYMSSPSAAAAATTRRSLREKTKQKKTTQDKHRRRTKQNRKSKTNSTELEKGWFLRTAITRFVRQTKVQF